jgi:hypothetical protein
MDLLFLEHFRSLKVPLLFLGVVITAVVSIVLLRRTVIGSLASPTEPTNAQPSCLECT